MLFDQPIRRDPLFWFGIVGGVVGSVISVVVKDLSGLDAVWEFVGGTVGFTWVFAGTICAVVRALWRNWRSRRAEIDAILAESAE
jgi:hypothetical protein